MKDMYIVNTVNLSQHYTVDINEINMMTSSLLTYSFKHVHVHTN